MPYALLFTTDHSVDNAYSLRSAAISPPENSKGGQMLGTQPAITSDLKFGTLGDAKGGIWKLWGTQPVLPQTWSAGH